MIVGDFPPSFGLDGGCKDLHLVTAEAAGIRTELLDSVRTLFDRAANDGRGKDDIAAVYTAITR